MRRHLRTAIVVALAAVVVAAFLYNVDLRGVAAAIVHTRYQWLALSLATMFVNLAVRALRWQYLLEPLGRVSFGSSFRATAVGFAATGVLPARAGEVIRPYFLARHERMSATGAFATIIIERLLDVLTVLVLLASYVFVFGRDLAAANPTMFLALKWSGAIAGAIACGALVVLFGFAVTLGLHVSLRITQSRLAIANTLGTVFFLSVGTLISIYLIVINGGSFANQWVSFISFLVLGIGGLLYVLSADRPSPALTLASILCPLAMFYCIVNVLIGRPGTDESGDPLGPFMVLGASFGFAICAMLVPLLTEFDVALGRATQPNEE